MVLASKKKKRCNRNEWGKIIKNSEYHHHSPCLRMLRPKRSFAHIWVRAQCSSLTSFAENEQICWWSFFSSKRIPLQRLTKSDSFCCIHSSIRIPVFGTNTTKCRSEEQNRRPKKCEQGIERRMRVFGWNSRFVRVYFHRIGKAKKMWMLRKGQISGWTERNY